MCTDKVKYKKNHIRNVLILFEWWEVDAESENHIRNVLISIEGGG